MKQRGEPRVIIDETSVDKTPGIRPRIPPLNTDFISIVTQREPHLLEPVVTAAKKINSVITGVNLSSPFHHTIILNSTAANDDFYAHLPLKVAGTTLVMYGSVRMKIASDVKVQVNCYSPSYSGVLGSIVIPANLGPTDIIVNRQMTKAKVGELAVLTFDAMNAGAVTSLPGIVAVTLEWTQ